MDVARWPGILGICFVGIFSCVVEPNDPEPISKPVTDRPGGPKLWEGNLGNGNLQLAADLSVVGVGLVYNSIDSDHQEGCGFGWRLNIRSSLSQDSSGNVTITRPDGTPVVFSASGSGWSPEPLVFTRLSRDGQNFVESLLGGTRFIYRPFNADQYFLYQIVDRNDNTVTINRDNRGHETSLVDEHNRVLTFLWQGDWLQSVQDSEGRTFVMGIDRQTGELQSITHPTVEAGTPVVRFHNDPGGSHQVLSVSSPAGMFTDMTYYADGSLKTLADSTGFAMAVSYTKDTVTMAFLYGRRLIQRFSEGELVSLGNEFDAWVQYERDSRHRITKIIDPLGHSWTLQYNDNDDLTYERNPIGLESIFEFDGNHNPLRIIRRGLSSDYQYDSFNLVTQEINPRGETTTYQRDSRGNLVQIVDYTGKVRMRAEYNADGTVRKFTDMYGDSTTLEYDEYGNVTSIDHPDIGTATRNSSPLGLLLEQTSALGDHTTFSYDSRGSATGYTHRPKSSRREGTVMTDNLKRDLDSRVVAEEYCGPGGCESASREFGPKGNVSKEDVNGTTVQDGECPCVDAPMP